MNALRNSSLFNNVDKELMSAIEEECILLSLKKGEDIVEEFNVKGTVMFLLKGGVKWSVLDINGDWRILKFVNENEFINIQSVLKPLNQQERYITLDKTEVLMLRKELLDKLRTNSPVFSLNLIQLATKEAMDVEKQVNQVMGFPLKERLINCVKELAFKFGVNEENRINLKISKKDIANFIVASKSSMNRLVHEMEENQIITIEKNGVKILDQGFLKVN